ncbi:MAG: type II methionyl aminopeptidase [Planctomycetes bacterium]|jgi:methionyl aminopeptidase|nr:type II methionyl aminopeptidase [Planctomycetota bacterium]
MDAYAIDCHRQAARIAKDCREWAVQNIRPGVEVRYILESIESTIRDRGAHPGFPAQSSRNHIAAHYCSAPNDELTYQVGDCVKVDLGVHVDGYVADTAASVDLSEDGRWAPLVKASADALAAAIATVGSGVRVGEIGAAIEETIEAAGFQPVRNLTGHGLGRWKVHTPPQIPNYADGSGPELREGMVFAIEPFACNGKGYIRECGRAEVFMMVRPPKKAKGLDRELLKAIESWRGLPIARRYFQNHDEQALEDTIGKLARQGSLMRYPPLVEEEGVMVAQTEHTMYLGPDGVEVLTA